jgi:hypothetical protein
MRVDHPSAGARAAFVVEDLEPFAVVQRPQRVGAHAFEAPHVLFATVGQRRLFERHGQALGTRLVLAGFGLERRAQRGGESTPAPVCQVRKVLFERIDADVWL